MNKGLQRWVNSLILLTAIVTGVKFVEEKDFVMGALALLMTFSYTFFMEDKK